MAWLDDFWERVYDLRAYLRYLLMFLLFALVLTGFSFVFGRPGTASRAIAYFNLLLIVPFGAIIAVTYWYSIKRHVDYQYSPPE